LTVMERAIAFSMVVMVGALSRAGASDPDP